MPRLLFDGWSYQDYMAVLGSEDEIEELGTELVDVAKVIKLCVCVFNSCKTEQGCRFLFFHSVCLT